MKHVHLQGTPQEMGQKLASFFQQNNTTFLIRLNKWQREHGTACLHLLEKHFPDAADEIRSITNTLSFDYDLFGAWLMCMGSCLITRADYNVEVRGCTAFCFTDQGSIYYGRDNDLPPYLKEVSKSISYQPQGKNRFLLNTSSFVNGEEGINEHGFVAAMTFVIPKREQIKPGLNSLFLVRYLLEHYSTVQEGMNELQRLPISSSCNILLADKYNEMAVVECTPFEINIRYPEKNVQGETFLVTVNHFTSERMQKDDRSHQNVYSSKARYNTAYKALKAANYKDAIPFAQNLLSGKYGFMCQYRKIKFETIWSSVFDITRLNMFLAEGNPEWVEYKKTALFR